MKFVTIFDPKSEINFVGMFTKISVLAIIIPICSLIGLAIWGIPWGIDFLGGVEMQVKFDKPVAAADIRDALHQAGFDKNQVQQFGDLKNNEVLIRVERMAALQEKDVQNIRSIINENFVVNTDATTGKDPVLYDEKSGSQISIWLSDPVGVDINDHQAHKASLEAQKQKLLNLLVDKSGVELRRTNASTDDKPDFSAAIFSDDPKNGLIRYTVFFAGVSGKIKDALKERFGGAEIRRVEFVDSQVSRQLRTDGLLAVLYSLIAVVIYIVIRFDLYFSPGAIISLINDTAGALLVFVIGRVEFDTPSIAAMLTIVGYSINNTIVIYDRIRETVPVNPKKPLAFDELKSYVNKAINDTLSRTINTTMTVLFASASFWIFASGVIQSFAMVLTVGIVVGAFSSVFIAPAIYLFSKKYFEPSKADDFKEISRGHSHDDKAKGIV